MPELKIDKLAYGGAGFGRLDGKACFVPFTAPGDVVTVRIDKSKSSYAQGEVTELLCVSPFRTVPECAVFGICGGCNWQHIDYNEQCSQKMTIFADILWRNARVENTKIKPIIASTAPFAYRQRIQLKVDASAGRLSLGFFRRASHAVIDIDDYCAIAAAPLNAVMGKVREIIASCEQAAQIFQVDLSASADDSVSAVFHYCGPTPESLADYLAHTDLVGTGLHSLNMHMDQGKMIHHISGIDKLMYSVPAANNREMILYYAPDSFSQVNFAQNRVMVQLLLEYCNQVSPEAILDLYCGNGNFSLPLAQNVKTVIGFETSSKSIALAVHNAALNGIHHACYICKDSVTGVLDLVKTPGVFDLVIMDPPRTGAEQLSREIQKLRAKHIIYISCDPPTLGRDIAILQKSGYEVVAIQPVDMFPQTYHLESIAFLKAYESV